MFTKCETAEKLNETKARSVPKACVRHLKLWTEATNCYFLAKKQRRALNSIDMYLH